MTPFSVKIGFIVMIHNLKYKKQKGGTTRMMNELTRQFCVYLNDPIFCDGFILLLFALSLWFGWFSPFIAVAWLALFLGARRIISYFKK
tara:strand:- start:226 stop:492 length:267 start_codon:yes stop_codon:yes gene_type:complete